MENKGKFNSQTASEAGKKSAEKRRVRRGLKQNIILALSGDMTERENPTAGEIIAQGLVRQAAEGNIKAAEFIRDTIGEKPGQKPTEDTGTAVHEIRIRVVD